MTLIKKKKIYAIFSVLLILSIAIITIANTNSVEAGEDKPNLTITYKGTSKTTSQDISGKVNEEINVTYTVTPEPLNIADINTTSISKEIVLVLDTSGSMNQSIPGSTSRIEALRTAAKNFVDKFKNETNVKIGIISYSKNANNIIGLTSTNGSNNQKILKDKIGGLQTNGATNIGDGIRYGLNMLSNGSSTAKKYIILMSDGEPTQYTYKSAQWIWDFWPLFGHWGSSDYYTQLNNDGTQKYAGGGNNDSNGKSLNYASIMAQKIKEMKYSSYTIAYSSGASANKMLKLANDSDGKYFSALDAAAIDQVYSNIADQIRSVYVVEGVNFNFTLPSNLEYMGSTIGLTIDGNSYTKQIPNIVYRLDTSTNKYIADSFDISFKFRANKAGTYSNLGSGWNITYKGVNGTPMIKYIPSFNYTVSNLDIGFILKRNIVGYNEQTIVGQELQMNYSITPNNIAATNIRKPKQIVLVVDSSYSNKNYIKSFLNKFNNISDVNFALISYNTGAKLFNFGTETTPNYFIKANNSALIAAIDSITASSGSNLGEGLRKAIFALNNLEDVSRSIVIFGENNPDYYSYSENEDGVISYYEEVDNQTGSLNGGVDSLSYGGADVTKAKEYAKLIAQKILDTENLAISVISSGDGTNDDVLKEVSSIVSTEFNQIAGDSDIIKLSNTVNADFILNAGINEILHDEDEIKFKDGSNTLNKTINVFYNYDNTKQCYIGMPVVVSAYIVPNQVGQFNLNNSNMYYKYAGIDESNAALSFGSLSLNVVDNYDIKQGMFFKHEKEKGSLGIGESYISNYNSQGKSIAINSNLSMGALIKTNGQSTIVSIDINSSNLRDININPDDISTVIYTVNKDNVLSSPINLEQSKNKNNNIVTLTFLLPGGQFEETYYLINYNYKVNSLLTEDEFNTRYSDGVTVYNKCYIGNGKSDTYRYSIVRLPDLF